MYQWLRTIRKIHRALYDECILQEEKPCGNASEVIKGQDKWAMLRHLDLTIRHREHGDLCKRCVNAQICINVDKKITC